MVETPADPTRMAFILVRALVYATLFMAFALVFLPARVIAGTGVPRPEGVGVMQLAGIVLAAAGAVLAVSCVLTFVFLGRGTPMPLDPPRKLVAGGPYRFVRNPMYVGAGAALTGAALYYESLALAIYAAAFLVIMHVFVVVYEEPTLRRTFGAGYEEYSGRVGRWWPHRPRPKG